jgi:hypothetical protein
LNDAEMRLPASQQTDIYINAIKTEGEAAEYIGKVTAAIHETHEAAAKRARPAIKKKPAIKRKPMIDIAAVAEETPARKRKKQGKAKKKKAKNKGRKP